jgi:hypothetical protein
MNVLHILFFTILIKLNYDDILSKSCQLVDFVILAALILYLRRADLFLLNKYPQFLWRLTVFTYFLPLILTAAYCILPFLRSNLGEGDILYLYAVAPLVPGIGGFRLLFIASLLALPFALFNHFRLRRNSETETSDYFFPFIPFLTLAIFIINC